MKLKLKPITKTVINIIAVILLVAITIISSSKNAKLNVENNKLSNDIATQENIINNLTNDNKILIEKVSQLEDENNKLRKENESLESGVQELLSKIERLEKEIYNVTSRTGFKSYMPYQAITDRSSKQWELQQIATTNEDGIRCVDDIPLVAVGTGWGLLVGDIAIVTCENGNSFKVMIGDIKDDRHTDSENKTTTHNGCRCEFIVDVDKIDSTARVLGDMSVLSKYSGYVINIEKAN